MKELLFEHEGRLAEDLFEFSETIDTLVESEVSLQDFFGAVARCLNRVIQGSVFRLQLQALPDISPAAEGWSSLGEGEIILQISPPLPDLAARLVEQRLIHALKIILRNGPATTAVESDADRLRSLLGKSGSPAQRVDNLQRLGLAESRLLTVVAIAGDSGELRRAAALAQDLGGGQSPLLARVGDVLAVILREEPHQEVGVPKGLSVGLGEALPPERIHESWEGAKTALRFSQPSKSRRAPHRVIDAVVVDIAKVGCLRVLVDAVDHRNVRELDDVRAIHELAEKGPPDTLNVLEAVAATESIRQAAQLVHLHHNTVATRVDAAEGVLRFPLREIYGRTRLLIALTLYRLHGSSGARRLDGAPVHA
ncbi:hypothetical protein COCCU_12720 [Corynebacterium occultum]|uniref:PucR C-terminal helix-turn-helix domain-containing protein n=1 Tax=Corynebacterium occultum TaxID=2675219 RepID=A0A6B8W4G9_9CORY|nr:hypothetical protein COCCU_12720 [Corynebacterium occultum]